MVPEKGKLLERAGRKITGLKPYGQGSGIAEEDQPFGELGEPHRKANAVSPDPGRCGKGRPAARDARLSKITRQKEWKK
jgi:hypothetical protein